MVLIFFSPLSYSQFIQNLGRKEAADWASFTGSHDYNPHFIDEAQKKAEIFPKEKNSLKRNKEIDKSFLEYIKRQL